MGEGDRVVFSEAERSEGEITAALSRDRVHLTHEGAGAPKLVGPWGAGSSRDVTECVRQVGGFLRARSKIASSALTNWFRRSLVAGSAGWFARPRGALAASEEPLEL